MKEIILNLSKKQKIILSIVISIIFVLVLIYVYQNLYEEDTEIILTNEENVLDAETNEIVDSNEEISSQNNRESEETVVVHVIGEVNNPGVVTLPEGSRIIDAINMAGGKTEEADLSKINLAYIVEDGTQIYIPRINEDLNQVNLISDGAGVGVVITDSNVEENEVDSKVNINTASKEKLETLPGVGETTAQKIIDYREANGKFKTIEDIKNVSGIGDAKYESLKDKITVWKNKKFFETFLKVNRYYK